MIMMTALDVSRLLGSRRYIQEVQSASDKGLLYVFPRSPEVNGSFQRRARNAGRLGLKQQRKADQIFDSPWGIGGMSNPLVHDGNSLHASV
jgi:hypothetical protein